MVSEKLVSIIIPTYNEESNIDPVLSRLRQVCKKYRYEVIFVDDGSVDTTLNVIKHRSVKNEYVKYVSFSRNFGHQSAIKAGLDMASGDVVITMDCDLQHPVELIPEMLKLWNEGWDVVNTVRSDISDKSSNVFKKITAGLFYAFIDKITDVRIVPNTADFRLLDKKVLQVLKSMPEHSLFYRGIVPWVGFKQYFLNYKPGSRLHGKTKYSLTKMLNLASNGITSFSTKPLQLAMYLGFAFAFLSLIYMLYALYMHLTNIHTISGWTSVIISVLFLGGIQLLILGILGEYIGKILLEVKQRPNYIVKDTNVLQKL